MTLGIGVRLSVGSLGSVPFLAGPGLALGRAASATSILHAEIMQVSVCVGFSFAMVCFYGFLCG